MKKNNKANADYNMRVIRSNRDKVRASIETKQHQKIVRSYVYVEGDSDERFFRNYIDENNCTVRQCQGKDNVWKQLLADQKTSDDKEVIIYIVDADLDNRDTGKYTYNNVFTYDDTKDLESWIWFNSDFCKKYINEYASTSQLENMEKLWGQDLESKITQEAKKVGVLRYIDNQNSFQLPFSAKGEESTALMLFNFLDEAFSFNANQYLDTLISKHKLPLTVRNKTNIQYKVTEALKNIDDYFPKQVCTGHDLTQIFAAVFDSKNFSNSVNRNKGQEITKDNIESAMRTMLDSFYFIRSNLCKKILAYQEKHPHIRILKQKYCA